MELARKALVLLAIGLLVGCSEDEPPPLVSMGESAPEFGSTPEMSTVTGFLVGRWKTVADIDMALAKEMGFTEEDFEDAYEPEFWEFADDGTFFYSKPGSTKKLAGNWKESGSGVYLDYKTFDGMTIDEYRKETQKGAETGTTAGLINEMVMEEVFGRLLRMNYLALQDDGKRLEFRDPDPDVIYRFSETLERVVQ